MIPVHEVAKTLALFGLDRGKLYNPVLTELDKFINTKNFDIFLGFKALFFFDFDFDPETLTVKAVLESLFVATHVVVTLPKILVSPSPGVMNPHGIIGGNWTILEREFLL